MFTLVVTDELGPRRSTTEFLDYKFRTFRIPCTLTLSHSGKNVDQFVDLTDVTLEKTTHKHDQHVISPLVSVLYSKSR